ncbi:TIM barrel protein [Priestia aryabhattai]|uniref:TIM barrel protein n=1 Tax=Priestia TaxID=2800373 RepID=UPI001EBEB820|nr:TIM barrel protein [Priestia aryabhattai]MBY0095053.1 TIM barrel protein [Priestia aryabhattai]MBY0105429.1 TIM barrel protein [Priestia aryabhattai]
MKIAGMNITFRHYPFQYFLNSMNHLGISSIELWAGEPHMYVYRNALSNIRSIRKEIKSRDMNIVCYTPEQCVYPYNIAALDSQWRKESINYFIENLYAALELETNMMLITSGIGDFSVSKEESWKFASDSIFQLSKIAEKEGINLALEPLTKFESNLITDSRGLKRMIEEINSPSLKGMIDTVAMQLAGETPNDYFSILPELCHFHLVDGDSQSDAHLALDDGVLNWREYLTSLHTHNYQGTCTLEIMGANYYQNPQDAIMKSVQKVRELNI